MLKHFAYLTYPSKKFRKVDFIPSNLHMGKLRLRQVRVLTLRKSTLRSKAPALSITCITFHKIKEQHSRKERPQTDSISFILHFCRLLIFKLCCKWMKKAVSTHATKHSLLMADLTQTRVDEGYLAAAGYGGRGRKCCKHQSKDYSIYSSGECLFHAYSATAVCISAVCEKHLELSK